MSLGVLGRAFTGEAAGRVGETAQAPSDVTLFSLLGTEELASSIWLQYPKRAGFNVDVLMSKGVTAVGRNPLAHLPASLTPDT